MIFFSRCVQSVNVMINLMVQLCVLLSSIFHSHVVYTTSIIRVVSVSISGIHTYCPIQELYITNFGKIVSGDQDEEKKSR